MDYLILQSGDLGSPGAGTAAANEFFKITNQEAGAIYAKDIAHTKQILIGALGEKTFAGLRQNQRDALYDLAFNAGVKKNWVLIQDIKNGDLHDAASQFLNIDHDQNGNLVPGLETRRLQDSNMFSSGDYSWRH